MKRCLVLYDGGCGPCGLFASLVRAVDRGRSVSLSTIAEADGAGLLRSVPEDERYKSFHVVLEDGRVFSGGDAVQELASLTGISSLLFRLGLARSLASDLYRYVSVLHRSCASAP
jgi:predicted DCC family thiol-disulfide oxidoreductase YuxK